MRTELTISPKCLCLNRNKKKIARTLNMSQRKSYSMTYDTFAWRNRHVVFNTNPFFFYFSLNSRYNLAIQYMTLRIGCVLDRHYFGTRQVYLHCPFLGALCTSKTIYRLCISCMPACSGAVVHQTFYLITLISHSHT